MRYVLIGVICAIFGGAIGFALSNRSGDRNALQGSESKFSGLSLAQKSDVEYFQDKRSLVMDRMRQGFSLAGEDAEARKSQLTSLLAMEFPADPSTLFYFNLTSTEVDLVISNLIMDLDLLDREYLLYSTTK